jgi:3-oxoadipate enol-lactonase
MAGEQPTLEFLYREIDGLNRVDRARVLTALVAGRTTPPAALAALAMPVLCIAGEEDEVIPPESVAILAARIPGARLERVPAAGHSVYFQRAETFNRLVDEFLGAIETR